MVSARKAVFESDAIIFRSNNLQAAPQRNDGAYLPDSLSGRTIALVVRRQATNHCQLRRGNLDIGCGTGANLLMLSKYGDAEGVDISDDALAFCRERGLQKLKKGAAEELPYRDSEFDLITALDVVEHLDDDLAGLKEMRRVLRPGGRVFLFVPTFMFLWGIQDDVSNHRRRYRLPELSQVLERAGFVIERTTYANITFFLPILLLRKLMRLTGLKTSSENNINISTMNRVLGWVLGAESTVLRYMNLPFGVSGLCVARRTDD